MIPSSMDWANFVHSAELPVFKQTIDRLLFVAKILVGADAAAVLMSQGGVKHCIAESGLASGVVTVPWQWQNIPFKRNQTFIQRSPTNLNISRLLAATTGQTSVGLFIRLPLVVSEGYELALQLYAREGDKMPSAADVRLLKQVAAAIAREIKPTADKLALDDSLVSIAASTNEIMNEVNGSGEIRVMLDASFTIVAVSKPLATLLELPHQQLIGEKYFRVIRQSAEPLAHLFHRSLDSSLSSPVVEIIVGEGKRMQTYFLRASPFRPSDSHADMLDIKYWDGRAAHVSRRTDQLDGDGFSDVDVEPQDPAGQFLLDTLLLKRSIRLRDDTTYLTIRAWRNSIRQHQIKALRAVKRAPTQEFVRAVAKECATEIHRLVGVSSFQYVVPVPCGHSPVERCMSSAIGKAVGKELGLPIIHAFPHLEQAGSSHPKENLKRAKMRQVQAVPGPAIVIDDVATSGVHLGEASALLKASGTPSFAVAWLGGEGA